MAAFLEHAGWSGPRLALGTFLTAGWLAAALPANATNLKVGDQEQLANAINGAQNGETSMFTANITLNSNAEQVERNVTINGGNFPLSGNNRYRGRYVKSGDVMPVAKLTFVPGGTASAIVLPDCARCASDRSQLQLGGKHPCVDWAGLASFPTTIMTASSRATSIGDLV